MTSTSRVPLANILNIRIDAIDMDRALTRVSEMLRRNCKGYICVAGVHGVMEAQRSPALAEVYAHADLTIPDGMPLVWVGHAQGRSDMRRVTGPDFMREIFRRPEFARTTHYLYGGEAGVANLLRETLRTRFPGARIVGTRTPPFRDLNRSETRELIDEIKRLRPDIIWVGISCPKQEIFMRQYLPLLETKLMIGVGAAFDYHTGRIRDSADWVKQAGLQWLHRLIQDPKRLWKRYLRNNPLFVFLVLAQLMRERLHHSGVPIADALSAECDQAPHDSEAAAVNQSVVA